MTGVRALSSSWLANHAVALDSGQELLLRRWARPGWDRDDPDLSAAREARVLERLADCPVPAPRGGGRRSDAERCDCPRCCYAAARRAAGGPADLDQLLRALDEVHAIDPEGLPAFRRHHDPTTLTVPDWAGERGVWSWPSPSRGAPSPTCRSTSSTATRTRATRSGRTAASAGIVDWTTGCAGPAAVDLAHLRVNLAMCHGIAASGAVLPHPGRHPYWDIAIGWTSPRA